ncbi:MAG: hypothetical protein C0171_07120 [Caldisphaera sp.]|nr:MAG: hypothetical protein C0201_00210 [Caldisphaera sp.]PMP89482.1 MAG: hypothetical protein C0171_07120 [Caldisphaera sp.]
MSSTIKGIDYEIKVVEGFKLPSFSNQNEIIVGRSILESDIKTGTLGDSIAGLLIPPIEYDNDLRELIEFYKVRVTIEQGFEIRQRFGKLTNEIDIPIEIIPISRMSLIKDLYPCIFNRAIEKVGLDGLRDEYKKYIENIGNIKENNSINLSNKVLLMSANKLLGTIGKNVILGFLAINSNKNINNEEKCVPNQLLMDPYTLLTIPEGNLITNCSNVNNYLLKLLGSEYKCKRPSILSSSQLCYGNKTIVIKNYIYGLFKWFMAGAVSASIYPFKQTPLDRLSNEYKALRDMRKIIITPKIIVICPDKYESRMIREFIDGEVVLKSKDPYAWSILGESLAKIHNNNRVLGDPNPGNFVITENNEIALIDLEQVSNYSHKKAAWDIAVFFAYARTFQANSKLVKEALYAYAKSRSKEAWNSVLDYIKGPHLTALMTPLPNLLAELRLSLKDIDI